MATRRGKVAMPATGEPIRVRWTQDGRPRYYVRVNIGRGPHGERRQRRSVHSTLTLAREEVSRIRTDRDRGVLLERSTQSVSEAANAWLAARKARIRPVTFAGYEALVARIEAEMGNMRLSAITKVDIESFVGRLAAAGRARATSARYLFVLRSLFDEAVECGVLTRNPASRVEPAGRDARARRALSTIDVGKVRAQFERDPLYACWLLTLYGLRRSEVLGLMWSDLNLTDGTMAITRSRVAVDGKRTVVGPTKTKRGTRTLPIPDDLLTALRAMREQQAAELGFEHVRSGYIAVDAVGRPIRHERWTDLWAKACLAAGVPAVPLHAARHTSVSLMRDASVPDHVVAHWHGHDEAVMRSVYSHADDAGLAAAGATLGGLLRGDTGGLSANTVPTVIDDTAAHVVQA